MACFKHYPSQRRAVLELLLDGVLPDLAAGRLAPRTFVANDDGSLAIQMITAAVLQMLQVKSPIPVVLEGHITNGRLRSRKVIGYILI